MERERERADRCGGSCVRRTYERKNRVGPGGGDWTDCVNDNEVEHHIQLLSPFRGNNRFASSFFFTGVLTEVFKKTASN